MIVNIKDLFIDTDDIASIEIKGEDGDWYATIRMKHKDKIFIENFEIKKELLDELRKIFKDTKWKI